MYYCVDRLQSNLTEGDPAWDVAEFKEITYRVRDHNVGMSVDPSLMSPGFTKCSRQIWIYWERNLPHTPPGVPAKTILMFSCMTRLLSYHTTCQTSWLIEMGVCTHKIFCLDTMSVAWIVRHNLWQLAKSGLIMQWNDLLNLNLD